MNLALKQRGLWSLDELSSSDAQALLSAAQSLKCMSDGGALLKGKHLALLCDRAEGDGPDVFTEAAQGLGAQVSRIRPMAAGLVGLSRMQDTAKVLGRLYDAIECGDMPWTSRQDLARAVAVPMFNVLGGDRHPTRMLADLMTMRELSAAPIESLSLQVVGSEDAPWCLAWRKLAAVTGITVRAIAARDQAAPAVPAAQAMQAMQAAQSAQCDRAAPGAPGERSERPGEFVCDPLGERCADGHPALQMLHRSAARSASVARRQVCNHRFVVQALLVLAIT